MTRGELGCIVTPGQGNRIPDNAVFCMDNGRFGQGWRGDLWYMAWLNKYRQYSHRCLFALAPDEPFNMAATIPLSLRWVDMISRAGFPPALALQDGAEDMRIPWGEFPVIFIAGSTDWKTSHQAADLCRQARARGKHVHMGRVNSIRRLKQAWGMGCDSVDGGWFRQHPQRLADCERALAELRRNGAQTVV